jgi:hypothetical protein
MRKVATRFRFEQSGQAIERLCPGEAPGCSGRLAHSPDRYVRI